TVFTLNWLPLGGFVRLKGENPAALANKDDPEALSNKSYFAQSVIILGGVFMNFLLAIIIFSILFFVGVKPVGVNNKIDTNLNVKLIPTQQQALESGLLQKGEGILLYPVENSIAEKAGIITGDILASVNGVSTSTPEELINLIGENKSSTLKLEILRKFPCNECPKGTMCKPCKSDENIIVNVVTSAEGKIGSYLSPNISINHDFEYKFGVLESIKYGVLETYNQSLLTFKAIGILIKKLVNPETPQERTEAVENMKGPIGIVDLVANSLEAGIIFLLILSAIISINLGVFNLLPIPALDGGRFLFISINALIAKIFGKKAITENLENFIHVFFFIVLIALSILIGYNDVVNIINR
ncbi:site-2 protease family protein, partial [Candidatus Gracilibacteria bacterium]|nr:site-2 protease family protein [Candidatus Gracilibacteria bacterium]